MLGNPVSWRRHQQILQICHMHSRPRIERLENVIGLEKEHILSLNITV
jgi:hypothetical protein